MKTNRQQVILLRKEHPDWTLEEIGKPLSISRERARQILKSEALETRGSWEREYQKPKREVLYTLRRYY